MPEVCENMSGEQFSKYLENEILENQNTSHLLLKCCIISIINSTYT